MGHLNGSILDGAPLLCNASQQFMSSLRWNLLISGTERFPPPRKTET